MRVNYKSIIKGNELLIKKHKSYLTVLKLYKFYCIQWWCNNKIWTPTKIKSGP